MIPKKKSDKAKAIEAESKAKEPSKSSKAQVQLANLKTQYCESFESRSRACACP